MQARLDFLIAPLSSGQLLHEQHQLLEVHLLQLRRPVDEEHRANLGRELDGALQSLPSGGGLHRGLLVGPFQNN